MIFFFSNNKFILFKCRILIALNLQSQTAISTIRQQHKGYRASAHGFVLWSGQTKDYKIGIFCFSVKYAALRKSKDWLALNQDDNLTLCP
jgi:hypothetical protein